MGYEIKALSPETWDAYADLLERHNGAGMGGCWCMWLHNATMAERRAEGGGRAAKERRVLAGRAHAAVVFEGGKAIGWCQFGPPEELPGIAHRKEIESSGLPRADYRLGCFWVESTSRGHGVAKAALAGALRLIAQAGGGVVEAYPYDVGGEKVSPSFLYNATRQMCEEVGFSYCRPKGKNHCIMRLTVQPQSPSGPDDG